MTASAQLLPLRIRLPYATEEEFIEKYGSNVARGGVFVATKALKPEGTGLSFEFVLADGSRMLRGEGVVVKSAVDAGGGRSGMTVRFVKLDARSKALVERVVSRRSGEPAQQEVLEEVPAAKAAPPPVPPAPTTPPPGLVRRAPPAVSSPMAPQVEARPSAPATSPGVPPNLTGRRATPALGVLASTSVAHEPTPPPTPLPVEPAPAVAPSALEAAPEPSPARPEDAPAQSASVDLDDFDFDIDEPVAAEPVPPEAAAASTPTPEAAEPEVPAPSVVEEHGPTPLPLGEGRGEGDRHRASTHEPEAVTTAPIAEAEPVTPESPAPAPTTPEAQPAPAQPEAAAPTPAASQVEPEPAPSEARAPVPSETGTPTSESTARADVPTSTEDARRGAEVRNRRRALLDVPVAAPVAAQVPEVVLGIDLGTTRARVAVFQEGQAELIPTGKEGTAGLPSVLAVGDGGQLLVGDSALAEAEREPHRAAFGLKRLLGLRAHSPQVKWLDGLLPFSVVPDARGDAGVELLGRVVTLSEFSTLLLRELKAAASAHLGREVTRAVLCVPSHFNDRQRAAVREAGTQAGLTVQRLLNAPAAAALAYGYGRGLARKRVLVVDLGGGGLEVAVVQVTGDDLEVITTGGDATLGGMEFDARLAEAVASELQAQGAPRPEHPLDWNPLRTAAESAKRALSERSEAPVPLRSGAVPPLSRERLEALTADLVQRVTVAVREVLESSALTPQGLDAVLLVGGQSRAPLVKQRLEESLGVPVRADVDPLGAVARGAALLGHSLLEAEAGKPAASVSDVLTLPLGVAERGGTLRRVLERNTRLPADKTLVLPVTPGPLALALYQGAEPMAAENEFLGTLELTAERPGEAELHFSLSPDGTLTLAATLPGGKRQPVTLATQDLDDAARDALLARSPLAPEPETRPAGLLSGLRKLFGRR